MIGLIDVDGKIPNLALMKISQYYKSKGFDVELAKPGKKYEKIFASAILQSSKHKCERLIDLYGDLIVIGGTGYDLNINLSEDIERSKPDYNLYTVDDIIPKIKGAMSAEKKMQKAKCFVNAGIGFTSRGCIRKCKFCYVHKKEPVFKQDSEIKDIINPKSNVIILLDNNMTADPYCIDKLQEIKDRDLIVDISQGIDIRLINDDIAISLSRVNHLGRLHFAWDLMEFEKSVMDGINIALKHIKPYKLMCYVLVGFNTSFDEDMYRVKRLLEIGISPYIMRYNERRDDKRLNHFARWVNSRACMSEPCFDNYIPWKIEQKSGQQISFF